MADVLYPKPSLFNSGWRAIPIDNWLGKTKTMTSRTVGEAPNKVRGGVVVQQAVVIQQVAPLT